MVHGQTQQVIKKTAELLQQFNGPPRFGKHSLIYVQSNRGTSETQVFSLKFLKSDGGKKTLNTSSIKNFDELPLFLNAQLVSRTLGVSPSSAYELLHEDGFPSLRIGSRLVVPKEQFRLWVERQTGGAHEE